LSTCSRTATETTQCGPTSHEWYVHHRPCAVCVCVCGACVYDVAVSCRIGPASSTATTRGCPPRTRRTTTDASPSGTATSARAPHFPIILFLFI
jgi:hypothetical protein